MVVTDHDPASSVLWQLTASLCDASESDEPEFALTAFIDRLLDTTNSAEEVIPSVDARHLAELVALLRPPIGRRLSLDGSALLNGFDIAEAIIKCRWCWGGYLDKPEHMRRRFELPLRQLRELAHIAALERKAGKATPN